MQNQAKLDEYYLKACQGDITAQKQLAALLVRDDATLQDGIAWFRLAAATDADAMYMLAKVCLKKLNDPQQALSWYEQAAQRQHVDAMNSMGACYLFGFQVERDPAKAIEWYRKAADLNSPTAYHNLGFLCLQDSELYDTALNLLRKAARMGYADSAYLLGVLYYLGHGVQKDANQVLENLILSVRLGKIYACRPIGDLYIQGVFDQGRQNPAKALEWYCYGMEHNVLSCIEALGDCYYCGIGVDVDYERALFYYKDAAEKGSESAAYTLGLMYAGGEGTNKNYMEALKWMLVAQKKGHQKAANVVPLLQEALSMHQTAVVGNTYGGTAGIRMRSSYSVSAEVEKAEQRARYEERKRQQASIYAAAGALSGGGSYADYEMGAVIGPDGDVSYVDADLGIILGADGSVSSHDADTGLTFHWGSGRVMAYDASFQATIDLHSGKVNYHHNGFTV